MKLLALKPLPHGVPAGDEFDVSSVIGRILIAAGVAREILVEVPVRTKPTRPYKRRDMRVEE